MLRMSGAIHPFDVVDTVCSFEDRGDARGSHIQPKVCKCLDEVDIVQSYMTAYAQVTSHILGRQPGNAQGSASFSARGVMAM